MADPVKAVTGIATCLGVAPADFSFDVGLKPIILGFLLTMPKLPAVVLQVPPEPNIPKALVEIILSGLSGLDLPNIEISLPVDIEIKLGNPNFKIPQLPGLNIPAFDPKVLIDFILGLIKVVIGLPEMLLSLDFGGLPELIRVSLGLPETSLFPKCLANAMIDMFV